LDDDQCSPVIKICPTTSDERLTLNPAVGRRPGEQKLSNGKGFRPISATAEQFNLGDMRVGRKLLADTGLPAIRSFNCRF
jgi:hypothetical protein